MSRGRAEPMEERELTPDPVMLVYRIARGALITGFLVTLALVVVTLVLAIATGDPVAQSTLPLSDLPAAIGDGDPSAVAELAIFAIVLTPVLTTLAIVVGFLRIGDRTFAAVSLLVLVVLSASMVVALLR